MQMVWGWIIIQVVLAASLIMLGYLFYDKRYRPKNKGNLLSGDLRRTHEVFQDPKDGKSYRVYFNTKTGEREYIEEP
ncbi:HD family phosphohydrolase [Marinicrinis sediminis]|uniref:HD family phosphohydrolase n=1 Tax=Marinicrinis sediminis TaxID=1652465 RepID=A0ABW5R6X1_9BACL